MIKPKKKLTPVTRALLFLSVGVLAVGLVVWGILGNKDSSQTKEKQVEKEDATQTKSLETVKRSSNETVITIKE